MKERQTVPPTCTCGYPDYAHVSRWRELGFHEPGPCTEYQPSSPTPSLPAAIREALDEYRLACRIAVPISYGLNAFQADAERDEDAARTALEAHLLALVEKAEAFDRLESRPPTWDEIETAKRRDARIAVEREIAALTPPEDTTPHE